MWWVVGSILHGGPIECSFQLVLHDWGNKGCGMCCPVCGMVHIKEPLLLIGESSPYSSSTSVPIHHTSVFIHHTYTYTSHKCTYTSHTIHHTCIYTSQECTYTSHKCTYTSHKCTYTSHKFTYTSHKCTYTSHKCTYTSHKCTYTSHNIYDCRLVCWPREMSTLIMVCENYLISWLLWAADRSQLWSDRLWRQTCCGQYIYILILYTTIQTGWEMESSGPLLWTWKEAICLCIYIYIMGERERERERGEREREREREIDRERKRER